MLPQKFLENLIAIIHHVIVVLFQQLFDEIFFKLFSSNCESNTTIQ